MAFCSGCGKSLEGGQKFCTECGAAISGAPAAAPSGAAAAPASVTPVVVVEPNPSLQFKLRPEIRSLKPKPWVARHPILTILFAVVLALWVIGVVFDTSNSK